MPGSFSISIIGEPICFSDQGVYFAVNRKSGGINNVFNLKFEDEDWYLYQLKNLNKEGDMGWVILADQDDFQLRAVDVEEVERYFSKPEYLEPKGAWQVLRNSKYGFGKFTPQSKEMGIRYSLLLFAGSDLLIPLLIEKAQDEALKSLAEIGA